MQSSAATVDDGGSSCTPGASIASADDAQTAEAYAYGTAWAILRVLDGQQPAAVRLGRNTEGFFIIPGELCPVPPTFEALKRWNKWEKFTAARAAMERCEYAGCYADSLADCRYLADHEAAAMHEALDEAAGLPDAAYDYGVLAESAIHFALNNGHAHQTAS
ncbi:hypothetical protein NGB36_09180 [Streptomyces sp. RB6PN25]|uniref:Uncharacterized protein n=1 Tax=Streptomyces humicola TaxID=2953240 RepID=A0ABT1PSZ6_9ACTN|nr:hypothetical protein [Streptomyces humicola]MCQ4080771.1 hypothetical protein [Streptomyces humicola]